MSIREVLTKHALTSNERNQLTLAIIDGLMERGDGQVTEQEVLRHLNLCQEVIVTAECLKMVVNGALYLKVDSNNMYSFGLTDKGEMAARKLEEEEHERNSLPD